MENRFVVIMSILMLIAMIMVIYQKLSFIIAEEEVIVEIIKITVDGIPVNEDAIFLPKGISNIWFENDISNRKVYEYESNMYKHEEEKDLASLLKHKPIILVTIKYEDIKSEYCIEEFDESVYVGDKIPVILITKYNLNGKIISKKLHLPEDEY